MIDYQLYLYHLYSAYLHDNNNLSVLMQDDSSLKSGSARKSHTLRAQTMVTDSFRMAASVLGPNASRKALTLKVASKKYLMKI